MAKFRKKPVVIEAVQFDGTEYCMPEILALSSQRAIRCEGGRLQIETLEGKMWANKGDWIICGVKGEVYPCKPDIFEQTYEPWE